MRIVRYRHDDAVRYGVVEDDKIKELAGAPYEQIAYTGKTVELARAKLLAPTEPRNIVAVGLNYVEHSKEFGMAQVADPLLFAKPVSAVIGQGDKIVKPDGCERLDYEAELAVVVKKRCRKISVEEARNSILGYTCLNDVTARDIQKRDSQWLRAKGFYTFCPMGPWIETDVDPADLRVQAVLNGKTVQDDRTSKMMFDPYFLVSYISGFMELVPGDIIATGTPGGIDGMKSGDEIKIVIEGVGELANYVE